MSFLFKQNCKKIFLEGFVVVVFLLTTSTSVSAVIYQPGATLDPTCLPTDLNCGVVAPLTASSSSTLSLGGTISDGSLFYVAGTSTLQNIIPAGNLQYSIGSPTSRLQNVYTNNLILGQGSFVMEDIGGTLRFRDASSAVPGLIIDPSSGATINGSIAINGGMSVFTATTTGLHSVGSLSVGSLSGLFFGTSGNVSAVATSSLGLLTTDIAEGNRLFWTQDRFNTAFAGTTSAPHLTVGTAVYSQNAGTSTYSQSAGTSFTALSLQGFNPASYLTFSDWYSTSTSALAEGANLYFTDARARNALSVSSTGGLSYSTSTGAFSLAIGNLTAPSNPEIAITGGTGAVIGSGLTFVIPEANATTRGLISTTTQTIAGDKTFSGALTVSNVSNPNAFIVTSNGNVGIGTVPDSTKQFQVKFDADKGALFDGRTNPRTVTVGVVRFEHTAGAEGTKPVFYDIDAVGYANTHATEVIYKTGAMTGEANVHDVYIDGTGASGAKIHALQVDVLNLGGLGKVIGLGTDPHVDPIEQHTGAYIDDTKSWYYNLSTYTDITAGTNTVSNVDESYVYVGADTAFTDFQVTLAVVASKNISPVFEFWNGTAWTAFSPTDGTNGFTNSGVISVTAPSWATTTVNGVSKFYVRIRRTLNNLTTPPQISLIQTNNAIEYYWDKTGKLKIKTIETTGNVGIGTSTPGYLLTMGIGGGYYNQATGVWVNGSDRAYKDNILTLEKYGLETVMGLSPVSYVVKHSGIEQVGFIAQEVRDIVPELVSGEDGAMGVNYGGFAPILVKAIQEIASLGDTFKQSLVAWFSDTTNGITDFFAQKIHTEQICLKKSDGNEYCINGDDLEAIIDQKLSTKLSTPDIDNGAKEDVVSPEQQPQESIAEFFPTEIETVAATITEEVTEITEVIIEPLLFDDQDLPTERTDKAIDIPASQEPVLDDSALITSNPLSTSDINNGFDYQSL